MRHRVLAALARTVTRHPRSILLAAAVVCVLAAGPASRLPLRTDRFDLVPPGDPSVKAYEAFNQSFGAMNEIFLILTGPPERTRAAADALAAALLADRANVRSVTYRVDITQLMGQALYALGPEALASLALVLEREGPLLASLARRPTASALVSGMAEEIGDDTGPSPSAAEALDGVAMIDGVLAALGNALETGRRADEPVLPATPLDDIDRAFRGLDAQGYLTSRDNAKRLLIVTPEQPPEAPEATTRLLAAIHAAWAPIAARDSGLALGIAGGPIQDRDEERTVDQDLRRTSLVAWVGVLALSLAAFRSLFAALLANLCLALAVYWTLAAAQLAVGQLNVISGVFVAIMVGLGIDFGIYVFTLYLDALPRRGTDAMRWALETGLPGIATGALTIAAAFFSLAFHEFRAFRELGIIAGLGVLMAFLTMLVVLPAIVTLAQRLFERGHASVLSALVSRALMGCWARRALILPAAALALCALALGVGHVGFDYDLSDLQSSDSDAIRWERVLHDEFGLSSDFIVVLSRTPAQAAAVSARLLASRSVASVDGVDSLVPAGVAAKDAAVKRVGALVRALDPRMPDRPPADDPVALARALEALETALPRLRSLAGIEESAPLAAAVDRLAARIGSTRAALASAGRAEAATVLAQVAAALWRSLDRGQDLLRHAGSVRPYTEDTLPPALMAHYRGRDGRLASYVWAATDLSTREGMRAFVEGAASAGGDVAGIPIMVYRMLEMIRVGYVHAAAPALAVIVLLVFLEFRRPSLALRALLPMLCGCVAILGWMGLTGRRWNPLSSIALPVMLGVGVSFGVNLMHRWRVERDVRACVSGTGRAVVFSALASMTGFGSLMLADHRGLASFGLTMFLATLAQMVVAVVVLPCTLEATQPSVPPAPAGDLPGPGGELPAPADP